MTALVRRLGARNREGTSRSEGWMRRGADFPE